MIGLPTCPVLVMFDCGSTGSTKDQLAPMYGDDSGRLGRPATVLGPAGEARSRRLGGITGCLWGLGGRLAVRGIGVQAGAAFERMEGA
jgi:hypothetical protein